jgi:putative transport protein
MRESLSAFLAQFPVVTLFSVIGIGYLLGQVRLFGFRLGVAGVLFAGLAAGALGPGVKSWFRRSPSVSPKFADN